MPISLRLLRAASLLLFAISALFLLISIMADFAPRQAKVYDANHIVIGTAAIPVNDAGILFFALLFFSLSGVQLWTIHALTHSVAGQTKPPISADKS